MSGLGEISGSTVSSRLFFSLCFSSWPRAISVIRSGVSEIRLLKLREELEKDSPSVLLLNVSTRAAPQKRRLFALYYETKLRRWPSADERHRRRDRERALLSFLTHFEPFSFFTGSACFFSLLIFTSASARGEIDSAAANSGHRLNEKNTARERVKGKDKPRLFSRLFSLPSTERRAATLRCVIFRGSPV